MPGTYFIKLQPSEAALASMAAQLFSSYIVAGRVTSQNENELMDKAVALAIGMARKVDAAVESDKERGE